MNKLAQAHPSMKHPLQAPQPPCHSECSSPLHLLCPSDTSSFFLCPGLDLPGSLSSSPHAWRCAGRVQPHPDGALTGAPCPGSQIRVEEGLPGDSEKPAAFQVGEQRPREGTGLIQGHTAGTPCLSFPFQLSLCAIK